MRWCWACWLRRRCSRSSGSPGCPMPGSDVAIRRARPEDATPIARLHVKTWRETYQHLAPEAAVQTLDLPYRHAVWVKMLEQGTRTVLVGEQDGAVIAIGSSGPA